MKVNQYELSLMVEAIQSSLTKEKRPRGEYNKIYTRIFDHMDIPSISILPIKPCEKCSEELRSM